MRVAALAVLLLALPAGAAAEEAKPAAAAPAKPGGRLRIEQTEVDAGVVVRGREAKVVFLLHNLGEGELKILEARPSCGCTVASFDSSIPPGGEGKVTAIVRTETFRGPIEKGLTLTTDDPAAPTTQLRIKANVVGSVAVLPRPSLQFPVAKTWEYSSRLLLRKDPTETGELAVTDVTTSVPWLVASAHTVGAKEAKDGELPDPEPGDMILEVSVAENAPRTQGSQSVTFRSGLPREPEVTIPVSVVLEVPFRVTPSPLVLRPAAEGTKERTGVLSATLRPGLAKEKLTAVASPDPFSVKLEPIGNREYRALVTWKPSSPDAAREGNVIFRLGEESLTVLLRMSEENAALEPPAALKP